MMDHPEYRIHKSLQLYIPPAIIILGTFGNLFAFVILKNKAMLKFSTYFFLMVMAVADTLVLYVGLFPIWVSEMYSISFRDQADWACKLTNVIGSTVRRRQLLDTRFTHLFTVFYCILQPTGNG